MPYNTMNGNERMPCQSHSAVKVLLINQDKIPHYRVPVYNYVGEYLGKKGFDLTVVSGGIQEGTSSPPTFRHREIPLSLNTLAKFIIELDCHIVIFWVNLRYMYLFPILLFTKLLGKKAVYWGHGRDLLNADARVKNLAYGAEHWICDAVILYAEHLKKYVFRKFHPKVFIANNTLNLCNVSPSSFSKEETLAKYHIKTRKNIICMGRMQKRKRLEDLWEAFRVIGDEDIGLILVGPDADGILSGFLGENVYKLGPIYGDERFALLSASDIYCLPGAVGLSIVDAFYCGLPIVTEEGDESPEIMYLKDGINGLVVPKGDVKQLAEKLQLLLGDDALRSQFSHAAKEEITKNGHIEVMCKGFEEALRFACSQ
jgi:L-malate glycosyltransferase